MFGYPNTRRRRLGRSRTLDENGEIRVYRFGEGLLNLAGVYGRHLIHFPERPLTLNQIRRDVERVHHEGGCLRGSPGTGAGTPQATGLRVRSEKPNRITPLAGSIEAQPVS